MSKHSSSKFALRKWGQRKLSLFVAREQLPDYLRGDFDEAERKAVEQALSEFPELCQDKERLLRINKVSQDLRRLELDSDLLQEMSEVSGYFREIVRKMRFDEWPDIFKWTLEAAVAGVFVAFIASWVPWSQVAKEWERMTSMVLLTEVSRVEPLIGLEDDSISVAGLYAEDEEFDLEEESTLITSPAGEEELREEVVAVAEVQTSPTPLPATPTPAPSPSPTPVATAEARPEPTPVAERGIVYRAFIRAADVEAITPRIRERIVNVGARRAGEVELGWRRPGGSYFHFTVPEANRADLQAVLEEFGLFHLSRDPHPRVMPDGILRFILWVEEVSQEE